MNAVGAAPVPHWAPSTAMYSARNADGRKRSGVIRCAISRTVPGELRKMTHAIRQNPLSVVPAAAVTNLVVRFVKGYGNCLRVTVLPVIIGLLDAVVNSFKFKV